ncbi:hypothetical protein [Sphingobium bisphenolivorans]|uniref:hypothetical protein n=1 Tax=Sphingobium bisphenolivorans TaxID=1335760 RepID=UPI00126A41FD|nr:hypothetical protein [Sphingobium bisphenolivorans]
MRRALVAMLFTFLPGCGREAATSSDRQIACSASRGGQFETRCSVERRGNNLTLRHQDGGFRRFLIVSDGRGLLAADGAEQAKITIIGKDRIELSAGDHRYQLPAKIADVSR